LAHSSARIGDGGDMAARGIVSRVNRTAARLSCAAGQSCLAVARQLCAASLPTTRPEPLAETRHVVRQRPGEPVVVALASAALVGPEDVGRIVVTGSHGGLLGGRPELALKADCRAAFFSDAGGGIDGAGVTRLPALAQRGIAAATVAADSAR